MTLSDALSSHLSLFLPFHWSLWCSYMLHNQGHEMDLIKQLSGHLILHLSLHISSHLITYSGISVQIHELEERLLSQILLERELVFEFNKSTSFHGLFDATHSTNLLRA